MQRAAEEGDKEEVDNGEAEQAAEDNLDEERPSALCIHYPCIAEPFAGGAGEYRFKDCVIHKQHPEKEPAESIGRVIPIDHIPVPCLKRHIRQHEHQQRIHQEIKNARAFTNDTGQFENLRSWQCKILKCY